MRLEDNVVAVAGAAMAVHAIFNRFECEKAWPLSALLLGVPVTTGLALKYAGIALAWPLLFLEFYGVLGASVLLYRVSPFHPLARYPGPILNKLSKFWMMHITSQGKQHFFYQHMHRQFGTWVRTGPNELSICDVDAIQPILGTTGLPKGPLWDGRVPPGATTSLIGERNPAEHSRRRKPWNRGFSSASLKGYEEILESRALQLIDGLRKQNNPVNLARWISYFSFDLMGDMAFGGGFEMMRDGDQGNILHLIEKGTQSTSMTGHVPWLFRYLAKLPKFGNSKFRDFAINRADLRRKQGSLRKDLFHYIFDEAGVEPHPPILEEALSDGILAIAAGSDTTSHVMSNIFWFLLRHPSCYERLQAEIDAAFPRGTPATDVAKQSELPYLEAVINETLRLQPPVPSGAQRSTQYTDGKMAGTHWIPKGTQVQINTYSIQRDPRYFWPAPEGFWPDRWLDHAQRKSNEVVEYKDPNSIILETRAFIPFSFGPAMCVAKKFATMEMKMVVCLVLHTFQLRFADGWNANEWEEKIGDYFTATRGPMPVVLTPRA